MTLPRGVADVLEDHVTLEVECIDRMLLNVHQPRLQHELGVVGFFKVHRGFPFVSSVLMDPISTAFVGAIHRFVADQGVDLVDFKPGQRKDDVAHAYLGGFEAPEGVLFVGRAQEKTSVFRTEKRRNPVSGATYPWLVRRTAIVNHFYFYCVDADFGPFFIKFGTYFPYNAKVCLNGNEWAKRQATKAGIGFEPLDNRFASCDAPVKLQHLCDRLDATKIDRFVRKWLARLPHPFSAADRRAGYRYDISILQAEFSLTQVLDRPLSGRVFFEEVIRENLDIGRPDRVSLIFDRRLVRRGPHATPGRFRTRAFTDGVVPSLHVEYKTRVKQYHKEGVALRTETTINNTRDFGIGKRLPNLPALRQVGFNANRRLLDVQRISHDPAIGEAAFTDVAHPVVVDNQRGPALRFGDPRVHALLATIVVFRLLPDGFPNRTLRDHLAPLLGIPAQTMTPGRMTYDRLAEACDQFGHQLAGLGWILADPCARSGQRVDLRLGRTFSAGNDGTSVSHLLARRRGDTGDIGAHRLRHGLDELCCFLLGRPSDLADHHHGPCVRVGFERLQAVDEGGSRYGIPTDADAGRYPDALELELIERLIGQRPRARHNSHCGLSGLRRECDLPGGDTDVAFARADDSRAVGAQ
ncbi:MAG: hypothetical protein NVS3B21_28700 [Acidimicrobiales bacterium]